MGGNALLCARTGMDRQLYRDKVQRCLDALARMLAEDCFSFERQHIGLEIELNLVGEDMAPAMTNAEVLEKLDDPSFQTELGQHNLELNVAPRPLAGDGALELAAVLKESLACAESKASDAGASIAMIGILPTLRTGHFQRRWLSANPRYSVLNERIFAERGEDTILDMEGMPLTGGEGERLLHFADSILPESANTSVQLHLQ